MINRFAVFMARRKAWQLFVALIAPTFVAQFLFAAMVPIPSPGQPPDVIAMEQFSRGMLLVGALMFSVFVSWLLSIGWVANQKINPELRPKLRWFFAAPAYVLAYFSLASHFLSSSFAAAEAPPWWILPLHLLAMAAIFYILGFVAKNIIMAERQSPVSFFDYSGPFFLLWFFPVGVWFVQPRVNRLVAAT